MFGEDEGREQHKDARELELLTIRNIMKTENGRAFMYRCLQNGCTFESIFSTDTHLHAFNSGKRSQGLWLESELKDAASDDYFKMLKENR